MENIFTLELSNIAEITLALNLGDGIVKKQKKLLIFVAACFTLCSNYLLAEENSLDATNSSSKVDKKEPLSEDETNEENSSAGQVVIVTAQKRKERITEVPIAISVFPSESIDQTGIQELREIGDFIPNMTVTQGTDFNSRILIRGVGAPSRNIGFDSRVGVYLDGVYLGQGPAVNQDLIDLERVEVLRGPQGTLFGKNTVAGAVSLVSKKPSGEFEGTGTINIGNYNAVEAKFSVDFEVSDTVSAKIAMSSRTRDGYITNIYTENQLPTTLNTVQGGVPIFGIPLPFGIETLTPPDTSDDLNNQNTQSFRAQLRIQPNDDLDINIAVDGLTSERSPVLGLAITSTFGDTPNNWADSSKNEVNWSFNGGENKDIFGLSVNVDYDLNDDYALRSITGYRSTELAYGNDTDYSPLDFLYLDYKDEYKQTTQEFQLISPDNADLKYVAGLYYYNQESSTYRSAVNGAAASFFSVTGLTVNEGTVDTDSYAVFISGSYQIDEAWKLGFGGRYSSETKDVLWNLDGSNSGAFRIGSTPAGGLDESRTDTNFSPTISINYIINDWTNSYAKYSTGFKSGGFNLDYITQEALEQRFKFDKETVESYEIGVKTSLLDDDLSVNVAYFDSQYQDYQVNQFFNLGFDQTTGTQITSIRIENAAEVDTSGLEVEFKYKVTDDFTVNGSLGFLDATFNSYPGGATETIIGPTGATARLTVDADGNKLPLAADFSAALGIQYYKSINSRWDILLRLDASHTGDYYTTINNVKTNLVPATHPLTFALDLANYQGAGTQLNTVPFGHIKATTILNGRIGLIDQLGEFELYLWGRNLTDEDEAVDSFREFFGTLVNTPRQPRTYGIEVKYNF